jgi:hypothetical protein
MALDQEKKVQMSGDLVGKSREGQIVKEASASIRDRERATQEEQKALSPFSERDGDMETEKHMNRFIQNSPHPMKGVHLASDVLMATSRIKNAKCKMHKRECQNLKQKLLNVAENLRI